MRGAEAFAAALCALEAELDWKLLGELYCHEGGDAFFDAEKLAALRETGLLFADDLATALRGRAGRSLYVGASVAELAPMLCESLVLDREVVLARPPGPETDELARAFGAVGRLPGIVGVDAELPRSDHVWLVSVLTDPEAFPALHDALYERPSRGLGDLDLERASAEQLVVRLLDVLESPGLVTTTDEELAIVGPACEARGMQLRVPENGRLTEVVGDVVRHCAVEYRAR